MNRHPIARCLTAALSASAVLMAGCTLPHYRSRQGAIVPAQPLNLTASQSPVTLTLHSVIVHAGPGAWKEETWWDEYAINIANSGDAQISLEAVELVDFTDTASAPAADPWKLEKESQEWWQTNSARNTGYALALGVGAYGVAGVAFFGGAAATGTLTGAATAATVVFAAVPVAIIGTVMLNNSQKHRIEAEFHRRRLVLPATLAPGATLTGSLFFRLSPGPQRLVLHYHSGEQPRTLTLGLAPLAALHFKKRIYSSSPAPEPAAPLQGK